MSTLAQIDPARAIRNALERIEIRVAKYPMIAGAIAEERAIVEAALRTLTGEPEPAEGTEDTESVRRCTDCGREYVAPHDEPGCPFCDLFAGGE
jgi:hypothetical protein